MVIRNYARLPPHDGRRVRLEAISSILALIDQLNRKPSQLSGYG
jgi:hypothetical protein